MSDIIRSSMRRLTNRLAGAVKDHSPEDDVRKYLTGSMTLFLNDEGRKVLRNRLDQMWDDLEEFQQVPEDDEKPYYFAFGFAPESYGHE